MADVMITSILARTQSWQSTKPLLEEDLERQLQESWSGEPIKREQSLIHDSNETEPIVIKEDEGEA